MILKSGLSKNALEELSSEKCFDDRIPHICNILRFALLKKNQSFMAIGGQWNPADGVDPSVDDTSSIHTVHRFALTDVCCRGCLEMMFFKWPPEVIFSF